jgi:hypothetical protein
MDMDQQEIEHRLQGNTLKNRLEMDEIGQMERPVHPDHYKGYAFDVIDIANEYGLDFLEGNVLKYLLRWRRKNGLEDLKKAQTYLNLLIEKQDGKIMFCRKL